MFTLVLASDGACIAESVFCCFVQRLQSSRFMTIFTVPNQTPPPSHHHHDDHHADMSSQPPASPSSASAPSSSQPQPQPQLQLQQTDSHYRVPSSPQSRTDSAVHVDEMPERADPDSSFQSNASERHPKGKRKRTAYVYAARAANWIGRHVAKNTLC